MNTPALTDRRLHELSETMRAFAEATVEHARLLDIVAERVTALVGDGCLVMPLSPDQSLLLRGAVHFRDPATTAAARQTLPAGELRADGPSLGARVVRSRQGLLLARNDLTALAPELVPGYVEFAVALGVRWLLVLPLELHGRVLGILSILRVRPDAPPFTDEDQAVARTLAAHAAVALSNAQLLTSLQREVAERRRAEEEAQRYVSLIEHSGE